MNLLDFLFRNKHCIKILEFVNHNSPVGKAAEVTEAIGCCYAATFKNIHKLEKAGLICVEHYSRNIRLTITDKGKRVSELFRQLFELEIVKQPLQNTNTYKEQKIEIK